MKKIGMISQTKKIFGGWDFKEKLSIDGWATVIQQLSLAGYVIPTEEVEKRTTIEVDPAIVAIPEGKNFSIMDKIKNMYGTND